MGSYRQKCAPEIDQRRQGGVSHSLLSLPRGAASAKIFLLCMLCSLFILGCASRTLTPLALDPGQIRAMPTADIEEWRAQQQELKTFSALLAGELVVADSGNSSDWRVVLDPAAGQRIGIFGRIEPLTVRVDLYPPNGFVALASASLTERPERIIALDRIERRGFESEAVSTALRQITGVSLRGEHLVTSITGFVRGEFPKGFILPTGEGLLRSHDDRQEVQLMRQGSQWWLVQYTEQLRSGELLRVQRFPLVNATQLSIELSLENSEGKRVAFGHFSAENVRVNPVLAERSFELATAGYEMRRRLQ